MKGGTLYGIGVGPGDPDLLTLKAVRLLRDAPVVAFFMKRRGKTLDRTSDVHTPKGNAHAAAEPHLCAHRRELAMIYPVTTEFAVGDPRYDRAITLFYDEQAAIIESELSEGNDVAVLAEGDPFFYGSFMHLFHRLQDRHRIVVVPGVTGMSACWTAAAAPISYGDDVLTVIPGTLPQSEIGKRLMLTEAAVFMKLGGNFAKVRAAIEACGVLDRAIYIERGAMQGEKVMPLRLVGDGPVPYFAIVIVPGQGRRL